MNAVVLGISTDTPSDNMEFKRKHALPYPLLCDIDRKVSLAYGAVGFATAYYSDRITFVMDAKGVIRKVLSKMAPREHVTQVLQSFSRHA